MVAKAKAILDTKVNRKGGDALELANLALACGLEGDMELSKGLFGAAQWLASTKHARAVLLFNEGILRAYEKK